MAVTHNTTLNAGVMKSPAASGNTVTTGSLTVHSGPTSGNLLRDTASANHALGNDFEANEAIEIL
ncbi:hypothetical protein [Acetobacter fabarum]|uniref:hypothetical protein n=1 Tax=Acetobacter fabarum TaxID=483199 RepID=UPI0033B6514F